MLLSTRIGGWFDPELYPYDLWLHFVLSILVLLGPSTSPESDFHRVLLSSLHTNKVAMVESMPSELIIPTSQL